MRRFISTMTVILMVFSISACGNKAKPEDTITKYFSAAQKLDSQAMAAVVSPANEKYPNVAVELMAQVLADYLKSAAAKMTYQITGSEVTENNAVVAVDVRYIDVGPFMEDVFRELSARSGRLTSSGQPSDVTYEKLFVEVMQEKAATVKDNFKEETLKIKCVKVEDLWYIAQLEDELSNAVLSGFPSFVKESEAFTEQEGTPVEVIETTEKLMDIANYLVVDIWKAGFLEISSFLTDGKGSRGQVLDFDLTMVRFEEAMEKKHVYDDYIVGLDRSYVDLQEDWNKLSSEIDKLYQQVKAGAASIDTGYFRQYMEAVNDRISNLPKN